MNTKDTSINDWIEQIVNGPGGFKTFEDREFVEYPDREVGIAEFVIRSLANPKCEGSEKVLKAIINQRKNK